MSGSARIFIDDHGSLTCKSGSKSTDNFWKRSILSGESASMLAELHILEQTGTGAVDIERSSRGRRDGQERLNKGWQTSTCTERMKIEMLPGFCYEHGLQR
jgi:hypothetical protein